MRTGIASRTCPKARKNVNVFLTSVKDSAALFLQNLTMINRNNQQLVVMIFSFQMVGAYE